TTSFTVIRTERRRSRRLSTAETGVAARPAPLGIQRRRPSLQPRPRKGVSMEPQEILDTIDRHFDPDRVTEQAIEIARTPCPQTAPYEREPLILAAIRDMYRPASEAAGCETWIDDYGNLLATQGSGDGPTLLFLSYAMAWTEGTMKKPWEGRVMDGAS